MTNVSSASKVVRAAFTVLFSSGALVLAIWLGLPVCFHSASASTLKFAVSNNCLNHDDSVVMNVCVLNVCDLLVCFSEV
jgi:hypothetical protein